MSDPVSHLHDGQIDPAGRPLARRVREAVDLAEALICGDAADATQSRVEGLAIAGRRAARVFGSAMDDPPAAAVVESAWVDHRIEGASPDKPNPYAVELVAADGQQAVDHCLVAHHVAATLGRPVLCTLTAVLAETIEIVRLAHPEWVQGLPDVHGEGPRTRDAAEAVRLAFEAVERWTGRPLAARHDQATVGACQRFVGRPAKPDHDGTGSVSLGVLPAGPRQERLLLDAITYLVWLGRPKLTAMRGRGGEPSVLRVGRPPEEDPALDMLVVTDAALEGTDALEQVREGGRLLWRAATDDPQITWAALTDAQRATILRRQLRCTLVALDEPAASALTGAILASTPELSRAVGAEGPVVEALLAGAPPSPVLSKHVLEVATRATVELDVARLAAAHEPADVAESTTPVMPRGTAPPEEQARRVRDRLREFHFTGRDPAAAEVIRGTTLRPAVLDGLEIREAVIGSRLYEPWALAVLEDRRRRRTALLGEADTLIQRLRALLNLPPDSGADDLAARLGRVGAELLDTEALLALSRREASNGESDSRQHRLSARLADLERGRARCASRPIGYLLCPGSCPRPDAPADVETLRHADALRVAIGLHDGLADEMVGLARALRAARLEVAGKYEDERHGPMLDRLDRLSLTEEERAGVPAVAVLETGRHLRGPALAAFSELLRSGRPITVLVEESVGTEPGAEPETGYHPGLGYLAVAHREAMVVQTSLGVPAHLAAGLDRARSSLDPVVVIAAVPSEDTSASPAEELAVSVSARATPCFVYDPAGGITWAERFSLDGNPEPDRPRPSYDVNGQTLGVTFADAAALDPAWRTHFVVVAPDDWLEEQVEVGDYLERPENEQSKLLPYVWVVEQGTLARAVISWELAFACRDRARAWRVLQELAGTENAFVRRAADEAKRAAETAADERIAKIEADFAVALSAERDKGAAEAIERLVWKLANPGGVEQVITATAGASRSALDTTTDASTAPATVPSEPPAEPPSAAPSVAPYIDSFLCTSCNDCINLNPQMFRYNADKQAEIADASAGTFKQLVKAAEACPARCIHPGDPRPGDSSATPALVKRAAKFN